jgi:membrane protease subunit HflK
MPWNNNSGGGGPWGGGGGGGGGPWGGGRGPGRGGPPRPPDFEELLRKSQDRLRNLMPGGMGSARGIILVALVVIVGWLLTGLYRVETNQQAIELVFGRPNGPPQGEGLKYNLPAPIGRVIKVDVTNQRSVTIGSTGGTDPRSLPGTRGPRGVLTTENLMLTSDENILDMGFVVFWQVQDINKFVFNLPNPDETVKAAAESAMRQVVGTSQLQFALTEGRNKIQEEAREEIQRMLDSYGAGIRVVGLALRQIDPPQQVIAQFRDVQAARADKERKINEANGYRNEIVPRAKGESEAQVQAAEGYRTEVVNRAQGDAQRFISVYQQYSQAKDITTQRIYLETMEEVLRNVNKVLLDKGGGGVVPYLPLPEIQKRAGPPATAPAPQGGTR